MSYEKDILGMDSQDVKDVGNTFFKQVQNQNEIIAVQHQAQEDYLSLFN